MTSKDGRRLSDADWEALAPAVTKRQVATLAMLITLLLGATALMQRFFLSPIEDKLDRVERRVENIDNCFRDGDIVRRREFDELRADVGELRTTVYTTKGRSDLPERTR